MPGGSCTGRGMCARQARRGMCARQARTALFHLLSSPMPESGMHLDSAGVVMGQGREEG